MGGDRCLWSQRCGADSGRRALRVAAAYRPEEDPDLRFAAQVCDRPTDQAWRAAICLRDLDAAVRDFQRFLVGACLAACFPKIRAGCNGGPRLRPCG